MLLFPDESYLITGCMMKVHRELGCGFLEKVYQEALAIELKEANVPFKREALLKIHYKGNVLQQEYIADFVCYDKIIVELKAVSELNDIHRAQLINYLKATGCELGLLANFSDRKLKVERFCNSKNRTLK
ncbi:MAG: GxxExxY protein [Muribaculaceae bacterium]|nr:GxxExxY protein [Muribaculaceae bacterium]